VRGILTGINLAVTDPDQQEFSPDVAADHVVSATLAPRAGDPQDCTQGCAAHEGDSVTLLVSLGGIPDVSGDSVDRATQRLTEVGLQVADDRRQQSSDTIEKGDVIGIADRDGGGNWRPGDRVTLIVSTGPPLFAVPNVVGMTRDQAKSALTKAGFAVEYLPSWDLFPDGLTKVQSQSPAADAKVVKGTKVSLVLNVSA
jgi:serine/threonine-protein kinase